MAVNSSTEDAGAGWEYICLWFCCENVVSRCHPRLALHFLRNPLSQNMLSIEIIGVSSQVEARAMPT